MERKGEKEQFEEEYHRVSELRIPIWPLLCNKERVLQLTHFSSSFWSCINLEFNISENYWFTTMIFNLFLLPHICCIVDM